MTDNNPLITVVVPVKNDHRVYRLIESLLHQTISKDCYEIIVVENGSSCLASVCINGCGIVHYLHCDKANAASARNLGLKVARGRYLLLTDADCIASHDWIDRMVHPLKNGLAEIVGGAILKRESKTFTQRYGITIVNGQYQLNYLPAIWLPYVVSANAGFVTEKLRGIGGFDEAFISGNDVDICYRLGLKGYRITLVPEAIILHEDCRSVREYSNRFRNYAIYQVLLFAKYKHLSGKRFVFNPYPLEQFLSAIGKIPRAIVQLLQRDPSLLSILFLQIVEAIGIWSGDIRGSIRYKQLYL